MIWCGLVCFGVTVCVVLYVTYSDVLYRRAVQIIYCWLMVLGFGSSWRMSVCIVQYRNKHCIYKKFVDQGTSKYIVRYTVDPLPVLLLVDCVCGCGCLKKNWVLRCVNQSANSLRKTRGVLAQCDVERWIECVCFFTVRILSIRGMWLSAGNLPIVCASTGPE